MNIKYRVGQIWMQTTSEVGSSEQTIIDSIFLITDSNAKGHTTKTLYRRHEQYIFDEFIVEYFGDDTHSLEDWISLARVV
jgi:hypothetical protein